MTESWAMDAFRGLFSAIDKAIYGLIATVYEILMLITKVNIFSEDSFSDMASKIYTLLGVFMLFKVTFSFISYLVNPDSLTDKAKGVQKVILNILLVLIMIILAPTAFTKLKDLQNAIITDNIIPKFILGSESSTLGGHEYKISEECPNFSYAENDGDYISLLVFRPFYQVEPARHTQFTDIDEYCRIGNVGRGNVYGTVSRYLSLSIVNSAPNGMKDLYVIDYKFFVSTIVGIVVLLILVSFCFDVAVRTIKLGFLQIIAPIPIISYVDPKSGKDGMFKKWLKEVGKTWADLFIRLIALFFAVYIIQLIVSEDMFKDVEEYKMWVILFIIIGALMFAKKLPKLIEDILGIKLGGDLTLNPMKKIRDNALGGKAITGALKGGAALAAGAGLGMTANTAALVSNIRKDGWKKALMGKSTGFRGGLRAVGTGLGTLAGGVSAGFHGFYGAYKNDSLKKGIMPGVKKSVDNRDKRDKEQDVGYGVGNKMLDKFRGMSGIKTEAKIRSEQAQSNTARLQAAQQSISYQQQAYINELTSDNISHLANITVEQVEGANGEKIDMYSFTDELGKKIKFGDHDSWNEADLKQLITDENQNVIGKITGNIDDVMKYTKLQARKNALDKEIFTSMKTQKLFAEKDAEANKKP